MDVGSSYLTRQQRVFTIVFEVATAKRIAMQIHARTQNDVATIFFRLLTDGFAHLGYQIGIPCRSQAGTDRECRGIVSLIATLADRVDTNTGRTIGQYRGGNTQAGNFGSGTGGTRHQFGFAAYDSTCAEEIVGSAY